MFVNHLFPLFDHTLFFYQFYHVQLISQERHVLKGGVESWSGVLQLECSLYQASLITAYILIHNEIKQNVSPEHKLLLDSLGIQH